MDYVYVVRNLNTGLLARRGDGTVTMTYEDALIIHEALYHSLIPSVIERMDACKKAEGRLTY